MNDFPYPNETWEEFADAQLDHEPTLAQSARHIDQLNTIRLMTRGY